MIFENGDRIVFAGDSVTDMQREAPSNPFSCRAATYIARTQCVYRIADISRSAQRNLSPREARSFRRRQPTP